MSKGNLSVGDHQGPKSPSDLAAEIDKENLRQRAERKKDSDKAFERQVDSVKKRQYLQTKECFSIWCAVCNKSFSNSLLSHTCNEQWPDLIPASDSKVMGGRKVMGGHQARSCFGPQQDPAV